MLHSVLGKQGAISAHGDKLIVRAPADKLEEIRWLISELDRPARNLLIEMRVDRHDYLREQRFRVGDDNQKTGTSGAFFLRESGTGRDHGTQRVRTLDGRAALIQVGQDVPQYEITETVGPGGVPRQSYSVQYRNATRGFYVLPRLHGKQVTLEIYQHDERQAPVRTGYFDVQHASSVLRGNLNEWIPLGSVDARGRDSRSGIVHSASTRSRDERHISVRVTALD